MVAALDRNLCGYAQSDDELKALSQCLWHMERIPAFQARMMRECQDSANGWGPFGDNIKVLAAVQEIMDEKAARAKAAAEAAKARANRAFLIQACLTYGPQLMALLVIIMLIKCCMKRRPKDKKAQPASGSASKLATAAAAIAPTSSAKAGVKSTTTPGRPSASPARTKPGKQIKKP